MATGRRHLAGDEELIHSTRRHWTTVLDEFLALIVIAAVAAVVLWLLPPGEEWARWARYVVIAAAVAAAVALWLISLLRWWTNLYILSTARSRAPNGARPGRARPNSRTAAHHPTRGEAREQGQWGRSFLDAHRPHVLNRQ